MTYKLLFSGLFQLNLPIKPVLSHFNILERIFNMSKLNSFISKTALAMLLVASLIVVDHNRSAQAAEEPELINLPGSFSGSFGLFSDYKFRGISQNDESLSLQGSLDWSHGIGFYLGAWASNVDFGDSAQSEVDLYFGVAREYWGITFDIGGVYYIYPGALDSIDYDYFEYKFGMSYEFPLIAMGATIYYTPENTTNSGNATYLSYDAEIPLLSRLALTGHIGHQAITKESTFGKPDFIDWSIGATYAMHGFDLSLTYIDTDLTNAECSKGCDGDVVFGISRSF